MRQHKNIKVAEPPKAVELEDSNPTVTVWGRAHLGLQR